ncbi:MAG: hypothetical protein Q8P24_09625 [Desulfobacterales bacterium]|nr:hypothetical protein [Desulfobacterales bacterium]
MVCKNCASANPDANIYCGQCGVTLKGKMMDLSELIAAGYLNENDPITCKVRGGTQQAVVLKDGRVQWKDTVYETPFQTIAAIRGYPCDSWTCWKGNDRKTGEEKPLAAMRSLLIREKS